MCVCGGGGGGVCVCVGGGGGGGGGGRLYRHLFMLPWQHGGLSLLVPVGLPAGVTDVLWCACFAGMSTLFW